MKQTSRREFLKLAGKGMLGAAALSTVPAMLPALAEGAEADVYKRQLLAVVPQAVRIDDVDRVFFALDGALLHGGQRFGPGHRNGVDLERCLLYTSELCSLFLAALRGNDWDAVPNPAKNLRFLDFP